MNLRPYQEAAIARLRDSFRSGKRAPLLVAPTGSGKTCMMSYVARGVVAKGGRVNWFAHRRELVQQAAATLTSFGLAVGHSGANLDAPVQVLSIQGVCASGEVPDCTFGVFDEAHHHGGTTEDWGRVHHALVSRGALLMGATATPERGDGRALEGYDDLIVAAQVPELVAQGHLVPVQIVGPRRKLGKDRIAQSPADAYVRYANGSKCIVFAPHVKAAVDFSAEFTARGIANHVVTGKTPKPLRDEMLAELRAGRTRVIINVMVLTEGFDCPDVDTVAIARDVGSFSMYMQICGRGMRPAPGKSRCLILDLRGVANDHGSPEQECEFSLDGFGMTRKGVVGERRCRVCQTPLGDATVCPECARPAEELKTPVAIGEDLHRWDFKRAEPEDKRVMQLARWLQKFPNKSSAFYSFRYKAVYGHWPPSTVLAAARAMVKA